MADTRTAELSACLRSLGFRSHRKVGRMVTWTRGDWVVRLGYIRLAPDEARILKVSAGPFHEVRVVAYLKDVADSSEARQVLAVREIFEAMVHEEGMPLLMGMDLDHIVSHWGRGESS